MPENPSDKIKNRLLPPAVSLLAVACALPIHSDQPKRWQALFRLIDAVDDDYDRASPSQKPAIREHLRGIFQNPGSSPKDYSGLAIQVMGFIPPSRLSEFSQAVSQQLDTTDQLAASTNPSDFARFTEADGGKTVDFFVFLLPETSQAPGFRLTAFRSLLTFLAGKYKLLDSAVDLTGDFQTQSISLAADQLGEARQEIMNLLAPAFLHPLLTRILPPRQTLQP